MFSIITKWMKITEKQICEDQIVTFKQSHILLYQGLLFLTRSTCVIVDARSHTCKSHDFIPRYDIIKEMNGQELGHYLTSNHSFRLSPNTRGAYSMFRTICARCCCALSYGSMLQWRHYESDGVSITGVSIVCSTVDADQRKHQSPASLAFMRGIHRPPVNFPHKRLVWRKMFPFDDVIMIYHFLVDPCDTTTNIFRAPGSVMVPVK